jgi:hypothetical protein
VRLDDCVLEPDRIDVPRLDGKEVAGVTAHEQRTLAPLTPIGLEGRTESRHVHPQRFLLRVGLLTPKGLEDAVSAHYPIRGQRKQRNEGPMAGWAKVDDLAIDPHFQRPEQPDVEGGWHLATVCGGHGGHPANGDFHSTFSTCSGLKAARR